MPAIRISDSQQGSLRDVYISGGGVGIEINNTDFKAHNVVFDDVVRPWDVNGGNIADIGTSKVLNDPKSREERSGRTSLGWRRKGPPLPSQCPHCKAVFPSRNYDFGSSKFHSRDNEETCRECGLDGAKVADGLFDLTAEAVRIIQGSNLSHAMLAAITAASQAAFDEVIGPDEFISQLAAIDTRLGEISRRVSNSGSTALAWFGGIVGFVSMIVAIALAPAAIESRDLAREQTALAREASAIAKAPNPSEELLRRAVQELADIKITLRDQANDKASNNNNTPSAAPASSKSPAETGSVNLPAKGKPKFRQQKRREKADRRRAFSPKHRKPSGCD